MKNIGYYISSIELWIITILPFYMEGIRINNPFSHLKSNHQWEKEGKVIVE